jgi:hypothetical protein
MRLKPILCFFCFALSAVNSLRAVDLQEPNVQVPDGFELRVLETPLTAIVVEGDKKTEIRLPVWVMTPKRGEVQENPEDLTEPTDYLAGANVLPVPPKGFTLRALKVQQRQAVKQKTGRNIAIDTPIWIYYKVAPLHPNAETLTAYKSDALTTNELGKLGELPQIPTPTAPMTPPKNHKYDEDEEALNQLDSLLLKYRQEIVNLRSSVDSQILTEKRK